MKTICFCLMVGVVSAPGVCGLSGAISTPEGLGLIAGGKAWDASAGGFTVSWLVSQNVDQTWHYQYTFADGSGEPLDMDVSHFIISVSSNLTAADVFNFSADASTVQLGMFGPGPSNPGFPEGQTLYGLKINLEGEHTTVEFDSVRLPMWGDFYAKGGGNPKNFAYNTDFGVAAANLHDYEEMARDADGKPLFKVLVPDTKSEWQIPEPATLVLLGIGGATMLLSGKRR